MQETDAHEIKRTRLDSSTDDVSNARPPSLDILVGETGRKLLQAQLNLAIINLICAACLPPTLVDYAEWKKLFTIANIRYHPMSSTTLVDDHIPSQAARVRKMTIEYLKTQFDLTVSYDGATTKLPQSVYTVHFTTADGRSFLIEGNEASDESHTGEHIARVLLMAMDLVGRLRFSGISGDSTGNTKAGRRFVCVVVRTIINMPDICHHTSLGCKDVCRLPCSKMYVVSFHEQDILTLHDTGNQKHACNRCLLREIHNIDHIPHGNAQGNGYITRARGYRKDTFRNNLSQCNCLGPLLPSDYEAC
jgi:hypothetical protein